MYRQFNTQQFYILPTQFMYVFCMDIRTNSDYFPIQHFPTGFYNRGGVCLLRGKDWVIYVFQINFSYSRRWGTLSRSTNLLVLLTLFAELIFLCSFNFFFRCSVSCSSSGLSVQLATRVCWSQYLLCARGCDLFVVVARGGEGNLALHA